MRDLLTSFLAFLPFLGQAQDTLPRSLDTYRSFGPFIYQNTQDSADFAGFWTDLRFEHGTSPDDTVATTYRLRWIMSEHGGICIISRGDSSILQHGPASSRGLFPSLSFQLADARRGVQVVHEFPCGLICRTASYYVEE